MRKSKVRNSISVIKLNTEGFCFFCLQSNQIKSEVNEDEEYVFGGVEINRIPVLLRNLIGHLQINLADYDFAPVGKRSLRKRKSKDIEVDLCESCSELATTFSDLTLQLERIQLEMKQYLKKIHGRISESGKNTALVEMYSEKMKNNLGNSLSQQFVDKLRKEIAEKSIENKKKELKKAEDSVPIPIAVEMEACPKTESDLTQETFESWNENEMTSFQDPCPSPVPTTSQSSLLPSSVHNVYPEEEIEAQETSTVPLPEPDEDVVNTAQMEGTPKPKSKKERKTKKCKLVYYKRDSKTRKFQCLGCEKQFVNSQSIRGHYESVHLQKRHKCDICNEELRTKYGLKTHRELCEANKDKMLTEKGRAYPHRAYTVNSETGLFHCKKCEKISNTSANASYHFRKYHLNIRKQYPCPICKVAVLTTASSLKKHRDRCGKPLVKPPTRDFLCDTCGKGFHFPKGLQDHRRTAHRERKVVCDVCGKKLISNHDLMRHKRGVHKIFPVQ